MNTNDAPEAQIVTRLREAERDVKRLRAELAAEREAFRALSAERDRWVDRSGRKVAELAAVRAAVDGEPVPTDASELVKAIAGSLSRRRIAEEGWAEMSRAVDEILANTRKIRGAAWDALSCVTRAWLDSASSFSLPAHDGTTVTIDNDDAVAGTIVRKGGERTFSAWDIDAAIGAFVGEILPPAPVYAPGAVPAPEDDGLTPADRASGWRWNPLGGHTVGLSLLVGSTVAWVGPDGWEAHDDVRGPETGAAGQRAAVRALRKAGVLPGGEGSRT